MDVLMQCVL